ncbi:hypothetical protein PAESOLCIP111_02016 [Paenibacillus solanacearum]|uniref:DUF4367 domain-containing protein n=1 Tax=Paenibacillus solanacearum TaxID=2048548 RepID=A0A916JZW4_9BACL|nr:hypothetical protein [Paenibacillus solanacearum]CAG7617370.1 hypothetical protein PAESOLCIP111_02016 [Paenibacillus solanacearum]
MSIEQRLKQQLERQAQALRPSAELHDRILQQYRKQASGGKRGWRPGRIGVPQAAVFAVLLVLLSGFAYAGGKLLFVEEHGPLRVEYRTTGDSFALKHVSTEEVQRATADVKRQLADGESAVVYFAGLEQEANPLYRAVPLIVVNKPETIADRAVWADQLKRLKLTSGIPETLAGDFRFLEGAAGAPFGGAVPDEGMKLLDSLKQESKQTGSKSVWKKLSASAQPPIVTYTTTYVNAQQEKMYLTVESVEGGATVQVTAPDSALHEQLSVKGNKAHYWNNDQFVFSGSGRYQTVSWTEASDGGTRTIGLGSDSPLMTKERLVRAAESLN